MQAVRVMWRALRPGYPTHGKQLITTPMWCQVLVSSEVIASMYLIPFSHWQFLNAIAWLLETIPPALDGRAMADLRKYDIANHIPNGGGFSLAQCDGEAAWLFS